jgi:sulfatase modifying factor 1
MARPQLCRHRLECRATQSRADGFNRNINTLTRHYTDVGAYLASASPFGTFDQGGNLYQYMERSLPVAGHSDFVLRGGAFNSFSSQLASTSRTVFATAPGIAQIGVIGFRVASIVPEPSTLALGLLGALGAFFLARKRRHN